jgi:MoxR-like ATPase
MQEAIKTFYSLREIEEFRKKPSTSELIDWLRVLLASDTTHESISKQVPYAGTLLKKEVDYDYFMNNVLKYGGTFRRR